MAMASAVNANSDGHHFGLGFSEFGGQTAVALGFTFDFDQVNLNFSASQSDIMDEPAYSGGFSWNF